MPCHPCILYLICPRQWHWFRRIKISIEATFPVEITGFAALSSLLFLSVCSIKPTNNDRETIMSLSTFTLVTSDNISIQVDPALLAKNSTVFADMMEMPRDKDKSSRCTVAETEKEIELMIEVLTVDANQQRKLELDALRTIVKLADKYHSNTLMYIAECNLWYASHYLAYCNLKPDP